MRGNAARCSSGLRSAGLWTGLAVVAALLVVGSAAADGSWTIETAFPAPASGSAFQVDLQLTGGVAASGSGASTIVYAPAKCVVWAISSGAAQVVAGNGTCGRTGDGGPATSAELDNTGGGVTASGVALDASGNLLIADNGNHAIRMVAAADCTSSCPYGLASTTAGDMYTVAGTLGASGGTGNGGAATSARLDYPAGVAVDAAGDLLIADTGNQWVRMVAAADCSSSCPYGLASTTEGDIYKVAGGGASHGNGTAATSTALGRVFSVAFDPSGDLVIGSLDDSVVEVVAAQSCSSSCPYGLSSLTAGDSYIVAGTFGSSGSAGDGGPATSATLTQPWQVTVDAAGNVLIGERATYAVRMVAAADCTSSCAYGLASTTAGEIYTVAGIGTYGATNDGAAAASSKLGFVYGVAVDSAGNLLIADFNHHTVRVVAGADCSGSCPYGWPSMTRGDLYTAAGAEAPSDPSGVAVDSSGDLLISDSNGLHLVAAADCSSSCPYGLAATVKGGVYALAPTILEADSVALDSAGNVLFADAGAHAVYLIAAADCSSSCPYGLSSMTEGDAYSVASALNVPYGVALDGSGNLLIADAGDDVVRLVAAADCSSECPYGLASTTEGDVYTVAGTLGSSGGSGDGGPAMSAQLAQPHGVGVDPSGDLLIADYLNEAVRLVAAADCSSSCPFGLASTTQGDIYTVAGQPGTPGHSGDGGPATAAETYQPYAIAFDGSGDLLFADEINDAVRLVAAADCSASCPYGLSATTTGNIYTVAGTLNVSGYGGDGGPPTSATLRQPYGMTTDASGTLVIADTWNNAIREVCDGTCPALTRQAWTPGSWGGLPGAPTGVSAAAGDGQATVSWSAPASDGGAAITGYTVSSSPGSHTCTTSGATSCTVTGLANGTSYTFTVSATNSIGAGPASAPSNAVGPAAPSSPATALGQPTDVSVVVGDGKATVSWSAPDSDGGAPITSYTVTASPGGASCNWAGGPLSCTVTGLDDDQAYTFTVTAANNAGGGASSSPSAPARPVATGAGGSNTGCSAQAGVGSISGMLACGGTVTVSGDGTGTGGMPMADVPPGAFETGVKVTVTAVPVTQAPGFAAAGTDVQLVVTSLADGAPITSFDQPIVLHFPAGATGTPEYSKDGKSWTPIPKLDGPALPAGQDDGWYRNDDGSIDVYTRHATYFALLKPAAPTGLVARLHRYVLTLDWAQGSGGSQIVRYVVSRDGRGIERTAGTRLRLNGVQLARTGTVTLAVTAIDAAGQRAPASLTVTLSRTARPEAAPRRIPRWAWAALHGKGRRRLPDWFAGWKRWRLDPLVLTEKEKA